MVPPKLGNPPDVLEGGLQGLGWRFPGISCRQAFPKASLPPIPKYHASAYVPKRDPGF